mgnify:CR=1 FL=1
MPQKFVIYGAYGFTGKLVARLAAQKGYKPLLAGRNEAPLAELANELQMPFKAFSLDDTQVLEEVLSNHDVLLNCAGPYSKTARPAVEACLKTGTHYLDITGELEVFEWVAAQGKRAHQQGVVLMPGTGFDVVPTDCLARFLKEQLPDATHLELAFKGISKMSRGTALTMAESMGKGGAIREKGQIKNVPAAYKTRPLQLQGRTQTGVTIPWGDVSTAYYSTGIPNVMVYTVMPEKMITKMRRTRYIGWFLSLGPIQKQAQKRIKQKVKGPDEEMQKKGRSYLWGEVRNSQGKKVEAWMQTPEGYTLTAATALLCLEKLEKAGLQGGFYTPSMAVGPDLILEADGVTRDLSPEAAQ